MEQAGMEMGEKGWGRLTAAAVLVRAIPTVVSPITHPELGDAAVVVALKLHRVAELVWGRRRGGGGGQREVIRRGNTSRAWPGWASQASGAQGVLGVLLVVPQGWSGTRWCGPEEDPQLPSTVWGLFQEVRTKNAAEGSHNWSCSKGPWTLVRVLSKPAYEDIYSGHS